MQQADLFAALFPPPDRPCFRPQPTPLQAAPIIERGYYEPTKLQAARARGEDAGRACAEKAERTTGFDADAARAFVLAYLRTHGASPGEDITDAAKAAGHRPHEDRAFGPVYATLARRGLIVTAGFCMRRKGNATAGGRVWGLAA